MTNLILTTFVHAMYLALSGWILLRHRTIKTPRLGSEDRVEHALIGALLLLHGPLALAPTVSNVPHFGAAEALTLLTWIAVSIYWIAALLIRLNGLQTILLPIACICLLLSDAMPIGHPTPWLTSPLMQAHFAIAMLAYGFLAVAAGMATLMWIADRGLHRPGQGILGHLPPLLSIERLLFATLQLGFVLLSATLITGTLFSEALFGKPMSLNHKSVLSIAAWAVFGILIWGRKTQGWRGRTAVRWTLSGFILTILAYMGSRFVLDGILHR